MKHFSYLRMGALASVICLAPLVSKADDYDKKTIVTLNAATEIPGIVLQPGTYVIRLLNSSSNRHIAEIMNEKMDHLYALTFTAGAERLEPTDKPVLTFYEETSGRPQALRKWFWPGDLSGQEFLYPKDQAAKIAAATNQRVAEGSLPTVADSGQGLVPDNAKGLSDTSSATVATSTSVSSASVNTDAANNTPTADTVIARTVEPVNTPTPVVIAQNTPPPAVPQRVDPVQADTTVAASPATNDLSTNTLPQTASQVPMIAAIGFASLALAGLAGFFRRNRAMNRL